MDELDVPVGLGLGRGDDEVREITKKLMEATKSSLFSWCGDGVRLESS